jgi:hypothetical protein
MVEPDSTVTVVRMGGHIGHGGGITQWQPHASPDKYPVIPATARKKRARKTSQKNEPEKRARKNWERVSRKKKKQNSVYGKTSKLSPNSP